MASLTFFYSTPYEIHPSNRCTANERPVIGEQTYLEGLKGSHHALNPSKINLTDIYRSRKAIARSIKFYGARLNKMDYVRFTFLNNAQRQALEDELLNTTYLLYAECQLHRLEGEQKLLQERGQQLERCLKLLHRLRNTPTLDKSGHFDKQHQIEIDTSLDQPVKYLALTVVAPAIATTMLQITAGELLEDIGTRLTDINTYRLNWVWGGGLDALLLSVMPDNLGHTQHAAHVLTDIKPLTGYMSWILYYFHLGINLFLLTRNTIKGSWMDPWRNNDDGMNISIYERFKTQLEQRKFAIINYFFWATANMACFLWLIKPGVWGCTAYMGNALTGALLLMDLYLTHCQYLAKETEYNSVMEQFRSDRIHLEETIANTSDLHQQNVLKEHLNVLIEATDACALDWKYTYKNFYADLVYACCLLASFSLLCCFFFPPAAIVPATAVILGIAGAALSFALTLAYHAMTTSIEIEKMQEIHTCSESKLTSLNDRLDTEQDQNQKQQLQLAIEQLNKELLFQEQMITHHRREMIRKIICEALVPVCALAFLIVLPVSTGLAALIPVVALLNLSKTILDQYKPDPKAIMAPDVNDAPVLG